MHTRRTLASIALLTLPLLIGLTFAPHHKAERKARQEVPVVLLESSDEPINAGAPAKAIGASPGDTQLLYSFNNNTEEVVVHDNRRKTSRSLRSLVPPQDLETATVGPNGNLYIADLASDEVRVMGPSGQVFDALRVNKPYALGVLRNGNVVVASTESNNLLNVMGAKGPMLGSFGAPKSFDRNETQNRFLNRGRIAVDRSDSIYYVSEFAPIPTVQKFSSEGRLLTEFPIEGAAIDYQTKAARELLSTKQAGCVGSVRIVTGATIDPATGHLWISMNGTTKTGVVYEYDAEGTKLREYAFLLRGQAGSNQIITGVKDLVVRHGQLYLLTWEGFIYRFNTANAVAVKQQKQQIPSLAGSLGSSFAASSSSLTANPLAPVAPQLPCPQAQSVPCSANCSSGVSPATVDCGGSIVTTLGAGHIVTGGSCTVTAGTATTGAGCNASANWCNTTTGLRGSMTVPLTCPSPTPTPTPTPIAECTDEQGVNCGSMGMLVGHPPQCPCVEFRAGDPVIVDVQGDGFNLTSFAGGVNFDIDADGNKEQLAWTALGADDSFLVLDRNGNGIIDDGSELFGDVTPQPISARPHGFIALAEYDKSEKGGNADGLITRGDAVFSQLRLWQDANHNGVSEPGELQTLRQLGLETIDCDYRRSGRRDEHGNVFRYRAKVKDTRGSQVARWAWDVFLVAAP